MVRYSFIFDRYCSPILQTMIARQGVSTEHCDCQASTCPSNPQGSVISLGKVRRRYNTASAAAGLLLILVVRCSWKERCRQTRVLGALLRQMMNRSVASAWRAWQSAVTRLRLSHIEDNAAADQASLRQDFLSRLQAAEVRIEEERVRETTELTQNFQDQL
eukprot:COSAG02_NODE_963_length_15604_cov_10.737117_11_plen_161_part_00